ncbi:heat shock protein Hsp33 [Paenibacillus jamilae]|uniref:Heat shock protein Hsp33 n=1 Tax=Paenibacillus jamilae TaxID=114136 RepID=A0ACC5A0B6_9BACL|nr:MULTISPECIES: Hsp33 family molecular chaperone HslO [Paenibacillus]MCV9952265.1 Hsp33 family molecular chaperone HslO [Paenibacillus sp. BT-177]AUO06369.1 Hsp33 family molecular chaperone HslO [Paenibacillus sp. lzh-N1]AZH27452.1 Hsp33 family molecular chaperone HslO [Paenibacillus sp. M-152]KAF6560477.1 Hsp33 family molecular chaperone HslO [Paenibacillus sp. EKM202P]KAF6564952.1 Hsp33 family molecular chaperone HslO [Paenibacillus sp. EKM207P]
MENKQDRLIRGTAMDGRVRAFAVRTTQLVEELRRRHDTYPTATAALGRTLTAGAIMGSMLKGKERLTIQVKGDGPIGQIVVDANAVGEVRGYVTEPHVHLPSNSMGKLDVAGAVGTEGFIHIIKDLGLKEPYRGSIPIISGELGEDFTYYFAKSEQTPSAVGLGVLVDTDNSVIVAGGFIIQLLPGLNDDEITAIENAVGSIPPVTALLDQGLELDEMLRWMLPDVRVLDEMDIHFQCECSRERVEKTLISLGESELKQLIEEEGQAEVVCHFCNEAYQFNKDELQNLLDQAKA